MIEIEVQNETHQTQERLKFVAVPRIGEGIRLREPDGFWTSFDVVDLWYQKAEFGDMWVPYLHVRITAPVEEPAPLPNPLYGQPEPEPLNGAQYGQRDVPPRSHSQYGQLQATPRSPLYGNEEPYPFTA